jgi:hypothetical protein
MGVAIKVAAPRAVKMMPVVMTAELRRRRGTNVSSATDAVGDACVEGDPASQTPPLHTRSPLQSVSFSQSARAVLAVRNNAAESSGATVRMPVRRAYEINGASGDTAGARSALRSQRSVVSRAITEPIGNARDVTVLVRDVRVCVARNGLLFAPSDLRMRVDDLGDGATAGEVTQDRAQGIAVDDARYLAAMLKTRIPLTRGQSAIDPANDL